MELKDLLNTPMDTLEHHGVKGMKWGVRRKDKKVVDVKQQTKSMTVKTKFGDSIEMEGEPTHGFTKFLAKHIPALNKELSNSEHYKLKDPSGNRVGEMQLYRESKDSVNVVWVGVDKGAQGKGYATAAMKGAVKYAKNNNLKKVTLEVPGNSPDARHIYEKLGFKDVGKEDKYDEDDIWGGLTKMELNLK